MPENRDTRESELENLRLKEKYLEVINSFASILFKAQSIDQIVWAVAEHAIAKLNYYDCVIYLYDDETGLLHQKAAYGPKNPQEHLIKDPIKILPGKGIVGKVFETGIGEIISDTSKDPRYLVDDAPRLSEITIPLTYKGEVIGVIDSEHPQKNFFNEQDFKMLSTVAAMISNKFEQAKAHEELEKHKNNLQQLVAEQTLELAQANQVLLEQNKEKEILIKEIHHRVKNNMQIMMSLLSLKINSSVTANERSILKEFQDRIRSMAIIHERLYLEKDISSISIDEYIDELSGSLLASFQRTENIEIETEIEHIQLDIDVAIPLGLIINELMTNSLKHAFTDKEKGSISMKFKAENKEGFFHYTDSGKGFIKKERKDESFGLELIEILVGQLNGEMTFDSENGVEVNMKFKL